MYNFLGHAVSSLLRHIIQVPTAHSRFFLRYSEIKPSTWHDGGQAGNNFPSFTPTDRAQRHVLTGSDDCQSRSRDNRQIYHY